METLPKSAFGNDSLDMTSQVWIRYQKYGQEKKINRTTSKSETSVPQRTLLKNNLFLLLWNFWFSMADSCLLAVFTWSFVPSILVLQEHHPNDSILITSSKVLSPNIVIFWGTGVQPFNIWILWGHSSICKFPRIWFFLIP